MGARRSRSKRRSKGKRTAKRRSSRRRSKRKNIRRKKNKKRGGMSYLRNVADTAMSYGQKVPGIQTAMRKGFTPGGLVTGATGLLGKGISSVPGLGNMKYVEQLTDMLQGIYKDGEEKKNVLKILMIQKH